MSEPFSTAPVAHTGDEANWHPAPIVWAKWQVTPRAAITVNFTRNDGELFSMFTHVDDEVEWVMEPTMHGLYAMWRYLEGCYTEVRS